MANRFRIRGMITKEIKSLTMTIIDLGSMMLHKMSMIKSNLMTQTTAEEEEEINMRTKKVMTWVQLLKETNSPRETLAKAET